MSAFNVQAGPDRVCGELPLSAHFVEKLTFASAEYRWPTKARVLAVVLFTAYLAA